MIKTVTELIGWKSTPEEREYLKNAGFVHVTGLVANFPNERKVYTIGEKTSDEELGTIFTNNSKTVVVTSGGEIWVKAQTGEQNDFGKIHIVAEKLNLKKRGVFVPLSNGEEVDLHLLLLRIANPDYRICYSQQ